MSLLSGRSTRRSSKIECPASVNRITTGHSQISPTSTLAPGEYAVVLRPISKNKKFSGAEVAQNQGSGLLFNSAWSFSVK